jgi:hypothetical protein
MSNIEWKVIPSYPNYEASNTGLIRRRMTGDVLKQRDIDRNRPYQVVSIFTNKKKYTKKVARLVWEAFNDCACGLTIDHIDQNKLNNNLSNLRCISIKENHANRTIYRNTNKYNLTNDDRIKIITKYRSGEWTTWFIMNTYKLPSNYIYSVIKRGTWDKLINGKKSVRQSKKDCD